MTIKFCPKNDGVWNMWQLGGEERRWLRVSKRQNHRGCWSSPEMGLKHDAKVSGLETRCLP